MSYSDDSFSLSNQFSNEDSSSYEEKDTLFITESIHPMKLRSRKKIISSQHSEHDSKNSDLINEYIEDITTGWHNFDYFSSPYEKSNFDGNYIEPVNFIDLNPIEFNTIDELENDYPFYTNESLSMDYLPDICIEPVIQNNGNIKKENQNHSFSTSPNILFAQRAQYNKNNKNLVNEAPALSNEEEKQEKTFFEPFI